MEMVIGSLTALIRAQDKRWQSTKDKNKDNKIKIKKAENKDKNIMIINIGKN